MTHQGLGMIRCCAASDGRLGKFTRTCSCILMRCGCACALQRCGSREYKSSHGGMHCVSCSPFPRRPELCLEPTELHLRLQNAHYCCSDGCAAPPTGASGSLGVDLVASSAAWRLVCLLSPACVVPSSSPSCAHASSSSSSSSRALPLQHECGSDASQQLRLRQHNGKRMSESQHKD